MIFTKKNFFNLILAAVVLCGTSLAFFGCKSAKTTSYGYESVVYLEIMGDTGKYSADEGVLVVLDGKTEQQFAAKVNPINKRAVSNKYSYKIATGAHQVEVFYKGESVLRSNIFASANQTKIITLP